MASEYKKIAVVIIGLIILKLAFFAFETKFGTVFQDQFFSSVISTKNILSLTNEARINSKKKPLKISATLQAAAQKKVKEMTKEKYFSHISPEGKTPWDFMKEAGYSYLYAGENLAINFTNASDVINAMLKSKSHRSNILSNDFTELGIGINSGIVVQMFGKPFKGRIPGFTAVTFASEPLINPINEISLFDQIYLAISILSVGMIVFWWKKGHFNLNSR